MTRFERITEEIRFNEEVTGIEAVDMLCRAFGNITEDEVFTEMPVLSSAEKVTLVNLSARHKTNSVGVVVAGNPIGRIFRLEPQMSTDIQTNKYVRNFMVVNRSLGF